MLTKRDRCALDNGESRLVFCLTDKSKAFDCLHNPLFLNWLACSRHSDSTGPYLGFFVCGGKLGFREISDQYSYKKQPSKIRHYVRKKTFSFPGGGNCPLRPPAMYGPVVERKVQIWWGASKSYAGKTKGKTKWDFFLLVNFSPRSTIWTPGTGYKLMRLHLTDRYHRVRFGDVISSWKEVGKGFLQGFSFGPPLWNVFQNDLTYKI